MTYTINKYNGEKVVDILDGMLDTSATSLALIGRNATNFGESINENFVHLLENFASASAPSNPIRGQIWYDLTTSSLKVFNGNDFVSGGKLVVQNSKPISGVEQGTIWIDSTNRQLKICTEVGTTPVFDVISPPSRTSISTTVSIDAQSTVQITMDAFKSYALHAISSSQPVWLRLYANAFLRSADVSREKAQLPEKNVVITELDGTSVIFQPAIVGFNYDDPTSDKIYLSVTNETVSEITTTITLKLLKLEA